MFDDMFEGEFDDGFESAPAVGAPSLRAPRDSIEMFGNEGTEKTLLSLFHDNKLPHALIFSGPQGVGKSTMAFRFARFLLKEGAGGNDDQDSLFGDAPAKAQNFDVAEDHPVFRKVASGGHPDLRYFDIPVDDKTGKRKTGIDMDTVREIAPFLKTTTSEGGWKIVIVDNADTMLWRAQNVLLKILEEPPAKSMIILVCNRLGAMLPTIRSRCRVFHFAPLAAESFSALLKRAAPSAPDSERAILAAISDGSMGRAQTLLDEGGVNTLRTLMAFVENWPHWEWSKIHPMAENLSKSDSEKAYLGFTTVFEWVLESILKSKAIGTKALPDVLNTPAIQRLMDHYSLEEWIKICEKVKNHFTAIDQSNLDKRQGVIGAFTILG